jgi:hypothetical protein
VGDLNHRLLGGVLSIVGFEVTEGHNGSKLRMGKYVRQEQGQARALQQGLVAHGPVALHPLIEHFAEHRQGIVQVVVDPDLALAGVLSMQASGILDKGALRMRGSIARSPSVV